MSIKGKIALIVAVPMVATVVLGAVGWWGLDHAGSETDRLVQEQFLPVVNEDATYLVENLSESVRLVLEADRDAHQALLAEKASIVCDDEEAMKAIAATSKENLEQTATRMAQANELVKDEDVQTMHAEFVEKFDAWVLKTEKVVEYAASPAKMSFARKISNGGSAAQTFDDMRGVIDKIGERLGVLTAARLDSMKQRRQTAEDVAAEVGEQTARVSMAFMLFGGVAMAVTLALSFFVCRGILRSLGRSVESLRNASGQTASAAGQVSSSSQSQAQGAGEQAASIEETTASLEEMTSMIKQNAGNAEEAKGLMGETGQIVARGQKSMAQLSGAIDEIKGSADQTAKIVKTIDEIAFQTNLLALNAAVEAARAGEAGKGFAVVAEEVRNLAQRSAEAAKTTADLIEQSVRNAENGVTIAGDTGTVFDDIAESAGKVGQLVAEIAAASGEQAQGIDQINQAVAQMDQVTQASAATAEESAAASEELSAQAQQLQGIVKDMVSVIGGSVDKASASFHADLTPVPAGAGHAVSPRQLQRPCPEKTEIPMDEEELARF